MRKNKDKSPPSGTKNLREKLYQQLGIPENPFSGCDLEIKGRNQALVCGRVRIEEYSENIIRLRMKDFDIVFSGENLGCPAYGGGKLMLTGIIKSVTYEERDG